MWRRFLKGTFLSASAKGFLIVVLFVAVFLAPVFFAAAAQKGSVPARAQSQQEFAKVNAITEAAVKAGVLTCASRINQVVNFLTAGNENVNTMLFMTPGNPDQQLVSFSMEVPTQNASAYASASFAPNQSNGCGAVYETVVYWPQDCSTVAKNEFGTLKQIESFSNTIMVLDGGPSMKIFLMPAGTGCVSIKKEIVH